MVGSRSGEWGVGAGYLYNVLQPMGEDPKSLGQKANQMGQTQQSFQVRKGSEKVRLTKIATRPNYECGGK